MDSRNRMEDFFGVPSPEQEESRSQGGEEPEGSKPEEVARSKRMARINAVTMALIFFLIAFAPAPYRLYAPILFVLPFVYRIYARMKRGDSSSQRTALPRSSWEVPETSHEEPYTHTPRDPNDPRRYKPIG